MIQRSAGGDERAHDVLVAEVRSGDERGAIIATRRVAWTCAQGQSLLQSGDIVCHGRNGDDVVAVVIQCVRIRTRVNKRLHGAMLRSKRRDVQRRAPVVIGRIHFGTSRCERPQLRNVAVVRGFVETFVSSDLVSAWRNLRKGIDRRKTWDDLQHGEHRDRMSDDAAPVASARSALQAMATRQH